MAKNIVKYFDKHANRQTSVLNFTSYWGVFDLHNFKQDVNSLSFPTKVQINLKDKQIYIQDNILPTQYFMGMFIGCRLDNHNLIKLRTNKKEIQQTTKKAKWPIATN